jgi:hypothetical protein
LAKDTNLSLLFWIILLTLQGLSSFMDAQQSLELAVDAFCTGFKLGESA